ncbi:MAG TPA: response regulator [Nitrospirales bacterium]|nr:response regulator [Nitrospirales bacterium]
MRPVVLIVDDDPDVGGGLRDLLEHEGYRVRLTMTGQDSIVAAEAERFDVVVLDLDLPDLDGLNVLAALHARDPRLPVIIATAVPNRKTESLSQGAFGYLAKPFPHDALLTLLSRALTAGGDR